MTLLCIKNNSSKMIKYLNFPPEYSQATLHAIVLEKEHLLTSSETLVLSDGVWYDEFVVANRNLGISTGVLGLLAYLSGSAWYLSLPLTR